MRSRRPSRSLSPRSLIAAAARVGRWIVVRSWARHPSSRVLLLGIVLLVSADRRLVAAHTLPMLVMGGCTGAGWFCRRLLRVARSRAAASRRRRRAVDDVVFNRLARLCREGQPPGQQERHSELVYLLSRQAGCRPRTAALLAAASRVHRIGHVALPTEAGAGAGAEAGADPAAVARSAARLAALLLQDEAPLRQVALAMARSHQERWDGQGLPARLGGESIPHAARLLRVALRLDQLIADLPEADGEPGRAALASALASALARLRSEAGGALDPVIACLPGQDPEALLRVLARSRRAARREQVRRDPSLRPGRMPAIAASMKAAAKAPITGA